MKSGKWTLAILLPLSLLTACGDFWQAPGGGGGGGCTTNCTPTGTSGGFYILNSGATPQIAGFTVVAGAMTPMSASPYTVPASPRAFAISPNGASLYVSTAGGVSLFPVGTGGALGTSSSISSEAADAIKVDATSAWLLEAITTSTGLEVDAVPLDATGAKSGDAQTVKQTVSGATVEQMAMSPDNKNVFVALGPGGTVVIPFDITQATTPLGTPGTPLNVKHGGKALSVAVDYNNRMFFVGETLANSTADSGGVRVFNYTTLKEVSGSPYASGGDTPNSILPTVNNVYVANSAGAASAGNIAAFTIVTTGSAYSLTTGSAATAGNGPVGLALDNTNTYVLAVNSGGSPYFEAYTFDTNTQGKLDPGLSDNTGASPLAIVASPAAQ